MVRVVRARVSPGFAVTATLLATALLTTALLVGRGPRAEGQPNPYGEASAVTTVLLAADGTQQVRLDQEQELVRSYDWTVGGAVHDGFRLPDSDDPVPPYLRVQLELESAELDGQVLELEARTDRHRIDISTLTQLDAGDHRASLSYRVRGAAVPADGGWVGYVGPLLPGAVRIESELPLASVECLTTPPDAEPCGEQDGDGWLVPAGDGLVPQQVRVRVEGSASSLRDPTIDRG